jgi:PAS domain S-box-containing protein
MQEPEYDAASLLTAIIESSDDAIVSKDLNGIIRSWNRAAERMFGYTADEVIGRSITIIIPEDRLQEEGEVLARIRRGERVAHFETVRRRKDGGLLDISLTVSPIRASDGRLVGASKIARDITVQKRLQQELETANRVKDEFLATLSHELRTPLNAVLGYTRILRRGSSAGQTTTRTLEIIERNATALKQLVGDILDISRIVTGKIRLELQPCDLPAIVTTAVDTVRPAIQAKGLHLELDIDPKASPVWGDPERLQQVFWNLFSNAVKFTPQGGHVQVGVARADAHVEITVRDTGVGISQEFLPHVFERFSQADSLHTRGHAGLGVGLAIVRHFVELHGGTVYASSDGAGRGATFCVELPLMSEPASDSVRV